MRYCVQKCHAVSLRIASREQNVVFNPELCLVKKMGHIIVTSIRINFHLARNRGFTVRIVCFSESCLIKSSSVISLINAPIQCGLLPPVLPTSGYNNIMIMKRYHCFATSDKITWSGFDDSGTHHRWPFRPRCWWWTIILFVQSCYLISCIPFISNVISEVESWTIWGRVTNHVT